MSQCLPSSCSVALYSWSLIIAHMLRVIQRVNVHERGFSKLCELDWDAVLECSAMGLQFTIRAESLAAVLSIFRSSARVSLNAYRYVGCFQFEGWTRVTCNASDPHSACSHLPLFRQCFLKCLNGEKHNGVFESCQFFRFRWRSGLSFLSASDTA